MLQVVEETGVDEELIMKFIKQGRLRLVNFPNLSYPCEKCGAPIKEGLLCKNCAQSLRTELEIYEKEQERQKELRKRENTYHVIVERYKDKDKDTK